MSFNTEVAYLVPDENLVLYEEIYLESDPAKLAVISADSEALEYQKKRKKNNEAVRRSREKSKIMYNKKEEEIARLRDENKKLVERTACLRNELRIYRDLVRELGIPLISEMDVHNDNRVVKFETGFASC